MTEINIAPVEIKPVFELEEFMNLSRETRLDSETYASLVNLWEQWSTQLKAIQLSAGNKKWLAVWLPSVVEDAVDAAWHSSPSQGYLQNSLAVYMCMSAIQEVLPQAADGGCAPSPKPDAMLRKGLAANDLVDEEGILKRKYAIVTYYPFKGGCEICSLQESCPKGAGAGDAYASILLPGHERQAH